jgi:hypothetical protein
MSKREHSPGWGGARPNTGGRREGAGRPPNPPERPKAKRVLVTLYPDEEEALRDLGGGSVTHGVRRLLKERGRS